VWSGKRLERPEDHVILVERIVEIVIEPSVGDVAVVQGVLGVADDDVLIAALGGALRDDRTRLFAAFRLEQGSNGFNQPLVRRPRCVHNLPIPTARLQSTVLFCLVP